VTHFQTAVLCDDNRFGLRELRGDFSDYRLLLVKIETQGLPPFVKAANRETRSAHGDLDSGMTCIRDSPSA
jgi:hypothetical protein